MVLPIPIGTCFVDVRDDRRGAPRVMKVGDSVGVSNANDCCPCGQVHIVFYITFFKL